MKKRKTTLILIVTLFIVALGDIAQAQNRQNVPKKIANYVAIHFPNNPVVDFEIDSDNGRVKYDVELRDGTDLKFNHRMNVIKIDSDLYSRPLPASVVPAPIIRYVKANFPSSSVVKWKRERGGYDVELDNDMELRINSKGILIKIDD